MSTSLSEIAGTQAARDRRLILRAVEYWESIRGDNTYPRMIDFNIGAVPDMAEQGFLIDINIKNVHMSQLEYVGQSLVEKGAPDITGKPVTSVPRGSLVSRLTDHFMQILANRAPMSFEAEYNGAEGQITKYRGIMMPLSNSGGDIDHILGVINCRSENVVLLPPIPMGLADAVTETAPVKPKEPAIIAEFPQFSPIGQPESAYAGGAMDMQVDDVCDMMDNLRECRGAAYMVQDARDRLMRREFKVLEKAFRLLHDARANPMAFAGVLEECEQPLNDQDLVAIVLRLVFGGDYPPEDMTLYATTLRRALRDRQTPDSLLAYLEGLEGGLPGLMDEEPTEISFEGLLRPR